MRLTTFVSMILSMQLALPVVLEEVQADSIGYRSTTFKIKKIQSSWSAFPPLAFAAAKKGGNKKGGGGQKKKGGGSTASSNRGFGIAPPTYEEVINGFQTRLPPNADDNVCPCGTSGDAETTYANCCKPYHVGDKKCQTMLDVLKTRYTAFTYRFIDYVIQTTHETCRDYIDDKIAWAKDLNKSGMFDSYEFVKLDVNSKEEFEPDNENIGYIDFSVLLRDKGIGKGVAESDDVLKGKETVITERSKFIRNPDTGIWTYASGDVRSNVAGLEDTILNQ